MAAPVKPVVKPDLTSRATGWLPFMAGFLCLGMLGMAVVTLFDVNAEPKSPPSGHVTAISAQGFAGLRRLLEAQGATVRLNRFEDGSKDVDRGDLEIITLDDDAGVFAGEYDASGASASVASSDSAASDGASESASESADASSQASTSAELRKLQKTFGQGGDGYAIPDARRVDHLLSHPLGRAVLVVAPKWTVSDVTGPQRRWGRGADLMAPADVANILAVLSPLSWHSLPPAKPAKAGTADEGKEGPPAPSRAFDRPAYAVTRGKGVMSVTLAPVAGQAPITAPLSAGRIDRPQSITGPNLIPVVTGPGGEALVSRVIVTPAPDGKARPQPAVPVYLVSDPDLLDNQILSDPQRT
ncbi:MAG: hypothetical protein ACXU8O_01855, partial [Asticcacaulis sp.]